MQPLERVENIPRKCQSSTDNHCPGAFLAANAGLSSRGKASFEKGVLGPKGFSKRIYRRSEFKAMELSLEGRICVLRKPDRLAFHKDVPRHKGREIDYGSNEKNGGKARRACRQSAGQDVASYSNDCPASIGQTQQPPSVLQNQRKLPLSYDLLISNSTGFHRSGLCKAKRNRISFNSLRISRLTLARF